MKLRKSIEVTLNVRNPINFCADIDRHLMKALENEYAGRCFMGAYIERIVQVLRRSECRITTTSSSGDAFIDVQFLAEVIVFSRWDILVGVQVVNNTQLVVGTYNASGPKNLAVVSVLASKATETLAIGQTIAVRTIVAQHDPMQPQATVVGTLLTCDQSAPVYRIRGMLEGAARHELAPMLAEVEVELEKRPALDQARLAFFERLLYAYREDDTAASTDAWPALAVPCPGMRDLLEIVRAVCNDGVAVPVAGYWSRPLALPRSQPLVACLDAPAPDWTAQPVDSTPRVVFAEFMKNVLDFLVATRELVESYSTPELLATHGNIWKLMRQMQRAR